MKQIIYEKIYLISTGEYQDNSLEYDPISDSHRWATMKELNLSFLKGLQEFVISLGSDEFYQLIVGEKLIFGKVINFRKSPYCYFVAIISKKNIPNVKKINKNVLSIVKNLRENIEKGLVDLQKKTISLNLKEAFHKSK